MLTSIFLVFMLLSNSWCVDAQRRQRGLKHSRHQQSTRISSEISENNDKSGTSLLVTAFTDSESLSACRSNVLASSNESKRFGPQEFANFLYRQSGGRIKDAFDELPPIFVLVFYTAACISCFAETNDTRCCVQETHIPLDGDVDPSTFYQILEFVCTNIDQVITDLVSSESTKSTKTPTSKHAEIISAPSQAPYLLTEPPAKATSGPSLQNSTTPSQDRNRYSNLPSQKPSEAPSTSSSPSESPSTSSSPSASPSIFSTVKPSTADLLCCSFSYTLGNTAGFSAEAIMLETNNTIKEGLLAATRNITISILGATTPATPRTNIFGKASVEGGMRSLMEVVSPRFGNKSRALIFDQVAEWWSATFPRSVESSSDQQASHARHLAFYTDEHPVRIWNVVDSLFCYDNSDSMCVSVFSEVCVVMAAGESSTTVRTALIQGFRSSIESGAFNRAIPSAVIP